MIPKISKFPLRTEFLSFRRLARKTVTPHTLISNLSSSSPSRLGVIIPKKVSKLATTRNYLKRLVYDQLWPRLKDQKIDVVVVFKPLPLAKNKVTRDLILSELSGLKFDN